MEVHFQETTKKTALELKRGVESRRQVSTWKIIITSWPSKGLAVLNYIACIIQDNLKSLSKSRIYYNFYHPKVPVRNKCSIICRKYITIAVKETQKYFPRKMSGFLIKNQKEKEKKLPWLTVHRNSRQKEAL